MRDRNFVVVNLDPKSYMHDHVLHHTLKGAKSDALKFSRNSLKRYGVFELIGFAEVEGLEFLNEAQEKVQTIFKEGKR